MTQEPRQGGKEPTRLRASWRAFLLVWRDYHGFTKLVTFVLIACSVLGIVAAFRERSLFVEPAWAAQLEKALASDAFRGLLALIIALLVAISIKRRQEAGLLDGDDHYSIGRALAFGYFKNFLVGALQVAKARGHVLHVFHPRGVQDLRTFESQVWPRVQAQFQTVAREIDPALTAARKPLVRRVVAMQIAGEGGQREFWLDFPTTLFTVGDYYESWNRWLEQQDKPLVEERQLLEFEQGQIGEFFRHLHLLMTSGIGIKAVQDHGLNEGDLKDLLDHHYKLVTLDDLTDLLSLPPPGPSLPNRSS